MLACDSVGSEVRSPDSSGIFALHPGLGAFLSFSPRDSAIAAVTTLSFAFGAWPPAGDASTLCLSPEHTRIIW